MNKKCNRLDGWAAAKALCRAAYVSPRMKARIENICFKRG